MQVRGATIQTDNTPAQRTVLWFAGFPLSGGKKYRKLDISAIYDREALNWLWKQWRGITKALAAFRSW